MGIILAFAKSTDTKPGDLDGHKFTKLESSVKCESCQCLLLLPVRMPGVPLLDWNRKGMLEIKWNIFRAVIRFHIFLPNTNDLQIDQQQEH